jgi:hypothetical protein
MVKLALEKNTSLHGYEVINSEASRFGTLKFEERRGMQSNYEVVESSLKNNTNYVSNEGLRYNNSGFMKQTYGQVYTQSDVQSKTLTKQEFYNQMGNEKRIIEQ